MLTLDGKAVNDNVEAVTVCKPVRVARFGDITNVGHEVVTDHNLLLKETFVAPNSSGSSYGSALSPSQRTDRRFGSLFQNSWKRRTHGPLVDISNANGLPMDHSCKRPYSTNMINIENILANKAKSASFPLRAVVNGLTLAIEALAKAKVQPYREL